MVNTKVGTINPNASQIIVFVILAFGVSVYVCAGLNTSFAWNLSKCSLF